MAVKAEQIFLVQGQSTGTTGGGEQDATPTIEQCVVVAKTDQEAYQCVAAMKPGFRPLGLATLADYESTARKIRASLKGEGTGWNLFVAPGMDL